MTDLQRFREFFKSMGVGYTEKRHPNGCWALCIIGAQFLFTAINDGFIAVLENREAA